MAKQKKSVIHCRYPKCFKLHDSTEMKKEDAVKGGKGNSYYHPDCYHTMQTVNEIRDLFHDNINPTMTGQQIGTLVSVINNLIFEKNVDVDYLKFALQYFIKYKPGKLHQPFGLHYIVQDRDVIAAWEREQQRKIHEEIKKRQKETVMVEDEFELDLPEVENKAKNNKSKFSNVLGV